MQLSDLHPVLYRFKVTAEYCSVWYNKWSLCIIEPPGGLDATYAWYAVHLGKGKVVLDVLFMLIEIFLLRVTAEALSMNID